MGTNFTPGSASDASRARTITTRSRGPASTTSAATWMRPTGSNRLFSGWTVSSLTPSRSSYLSVQTALPSTRPRSIGVGRLLALNSAVDGGVEHGRIHIAAQPGDDRRPHPVDELG